MDEAERPKSLRRTNPNASWQSDHRPVSYMPAHEYERLIERSVMRGTIKAWLAAGAFIFVLWLITLVMIRS